MNFKKKEHNKLLLHVFSSESVNEEGNIGNMQYFPSFLPAKKKFLE